MSARRVMSSVGMALAVIAAAALLAVAALWPSTAHLSLQEETTAPACPEVVGPPEGDPGAPAPPTSASILGGVISWDPSVDETDGYLVCIGHSDLDQDPVEVLTFVVGPDVTSFPIPGEVLGSSFIEAVVYAFDENGLSAPALAGSIIRELEPAATPVDPTPAATPVVAPPDTGTGAADASRGAATWVLALAVAVAALGAGALALRRARA
jgi:hypothetical protein